MGARQLQFDGAPDGHAITSKLSVGLRPSSGAPGALYSGGKSIEIPPPGAILDAHHDRRVLRRRFAGLQRGVDVGQRTGERRVQRSRCPEAGEEQTANGDPHGEFPSSWML